MDVRRFSALSQLRHPCDAAKRPAVAPLPLLRTYRRQDRWLAGAAPVAVLLQLVAYAIALICTLGLVVWGATSLSWQKSFYQSGATFTTLGIVVPSDSAGIIATFVAAFLGLVLVAVFVGYLIGLYSAFGDRESLMVRLAAEAGEPAWGPEIVARSHTIGAKIGTVPIADSWIDWVTQLRTALQVTPVLGQFRSTSSSRHWVISLLAVLDATALQMALRPGEVAPTQVKLLAVGADTMRAIDERSGRDLSMIGQLEESVVNALAVAHPDLEAARLSAAEWETGASRLTVAGVTSRQELDEAMGRFCALRALYVDAAYSLAHDFHAVAAPWSGARRTRITSNA